VEKFIERMDSDKAIPIFGTEKAFEETALKKKKGI
jgi:hypothetical protein